MEKDQRMMSTLRGFFAALLTAIVTSTAGYSSLVEAVDLTRGVSPGGEEFRLPTDIASGFDSDWERNLGSNKPWNITIVSKNTGAPVRAGNKAIRFEVRDGDCGIGKTSDCGSYDGSRNGGRFRSEMANYDKDMGRHGTKEWVAFSIYLPSNYRTLNSIGGKSFLGQWHYIATTRDIETGADQKYCCDYMFSDVSVSEIVGQPGNYKVQPGIADKTKRIEGYWFSNGRYKLTPNLVRHSSYHNKQLFSMKKLRGHWNDILIHVNWRYDKKGFFKVYANNKLIYTYRGATTWKHHNWQGLHFGIYQNVFRVKVKSKTQVVYFDEIRRGRSLAAVTKNLTPLFTYPNGKDILRRGKRYTLTWNKGNAGRKIKIELYRGTKRLRTVVTTTLNDGSYVWKIPSSLVKAANYRLRLVSKKNKNNYDFSDGYFSIK